MYLPAFAYNCVRIFFYNPKTWPVEHKIKNEDTFFGYNYNYKKKDNLFNIDTLYKKMPKKPFTIARKKEFEILLMYYWTHDIDLDKEYWQVYLDRVLDNIE